MRFRHEITIDAARCIGCGLCRDDCPASNLAVEGEKAAPPTQACIMCAHCVAVCLTNAVSISGFDEEPRPLDGAEALEPARLLAAIGARRSMRRFAEGPVSDEAIADIVEAGRLTPTGKNVQDVSYIVLRERLDRCEQLAVRLFRRILPLARLVDSTARRTEVDEHFFFKGAPAVIVVVAKDQVNGALAASNMELAAQAHGLGVLYSGFFALAAKLSPALRRELGLARGQKVVTALVVGHPAVTYRRTAPKEPADVRFL